MGARGPQPTPTAILKLHGSWRGNARGGEPQVAPGKPSCPRTLGRERQKLFRAVCRLIGKEAPECLTKLDGAAVERFVVYLARWRQIEAEIERMISLGGYLGTVKNEATRPLLKLLQNESHACDEALRSLERGLGLTPSARASLGIATQAAARD